VWFMIAVWERGAPLSGAEGSETAIMGPEAGPSGRDFTSEPAGSG
jgi:hypothetical protein